MAEFTKTGEVSTTGTQLYAGVTGQLQLLTKVQTLRFNNPNPYILTLQIYSPNSGTYKTIYQLTLSGGDTVTDNMVYALNSGEKLIATSSIPGTTYYIYAINF